jgi:hypothetical protein
MFTLHDCARFSTMLTPLESHTLYPRWTQGQTACWPFWEVFLLNQAQQVPLSPSPIEFAQAKSNGFNAVSL